MVREMTVAEEKKVRYEIALVNRTKPMFVDIERVDELGENERKVFCKIKGFKYTVLMRGDIVLATMARI